MKLSYPVIGGQNKITQGYGPSQIDYSKFGMVGHNGIDFAGVLNDPIMAAADGVVSWQAYDAEGYGNYIMIQHADSSTTIYAHLNSVSCKQGNIVKTGKVIGSMGFSGNVIPKDARGTHLHFGYRPAGFDAANGYRGYTDPALLLEAVDIIQTPVAGNAQKAKVVCDMAQVRKTPGFSGIVIGQVHNGNILNLTGNTEKSGGLRWKEFKYTTTAWIAEFDGFGNQLIEDE
jgi:murein DD-endopeptidase MepM/ murein hydrolase activator NlpD